MTLIPIFQGSRFIDWSYIYTLLPNGDLPNGIVLNRVMHDKYHLAGEISIIGFWISIDEYNQSKYVATSNHFLSFRDCEQLTKPVDVFNQEEAKIIGAEGTFQFGKFPFSSGLSAEFLFNISDHFTENAISNIDFDRLLIKQTFLFTEYGKEPPHEPGAILDAARLFPLIEFHFIRNETFDNGSDVYYQVSAFRCDYYFEFQLDAFLNRSLNSLSNFKERPLNQASIIRDREDVEIPVVEANHEIFESVEKPLKYEIASFGLIEGESAREDPSVQVELLGLKNYTPKTWDNIHQWGVLKEKPLPSAPGAFHAMHLHWRWGRVVGEPDSDWLINFLNMLGLNRLLPAAGQEQFHGVKKNQGYGGALIDENISDQSIKFAVVKTSSKFRSTQRMTIPSSELFEDYFTSLNKEPQNIEVGDNLSTFLSFQAFREIPYDNNFFGTFFVQGLYFAHNEEPNIPPSSITLGEKMQNPTPKREWIRVPK